MYIWRNEIEIIPPPASHKKSGRGFHERPSLRAWKCKFSWLAWRNMLRVRLISLFCCDHRRDALTELFQIRLHEVLSNSAKNFSKKSMKIYLGRANVAIWEQRSLANLPKTVTTGRVTKNDESSKAWSNELPIVQSGA